MTTDPNAAALRQLERRLFGAAGAGVPRLFLQVIRRFLSSTATTLASTHSTPSRHSVCWLDGTVFGALSYAEFDDATEPTIRGAVVPVRELRLASVKVHDVERDPATGEVAQWKRSTVFDLGGGKDLTFTAIDSANLDTDEAGRFADAVVLAMRQQ
jgi:hypothetical protein